MPHFAGFALFVFMLSVSSQAFAMQTDSMSYRITDFLTRSCIAHSNNLEELAARLDKDPALDLADAEVPMVNMLTEGRGGRGWKVPYEALGDGVLVLEEDGSCRIYMSQWSEEGYQEYLESMVPMIFNFRFALQEIKDGTAESVRTTYNLLPTGAKKANLKIEGGDVYTPVLLIDVAADMPQKMPYALSVGIKKPVAE